MIRLGLCAAALTVLSAPAFAANPQVSFERAPCASTVASDEAIECGILSVPENRRATTSRTIRLPVMIFRSRSKTPAADPVIFLPGGPGGSAVAQKKSGKTNPFLDDRDYILLEPRGAKMAQSALECPQINTLKGEISAGRLKGKADNALASAAADCRAALTASGVDLNGYTSAETAADIDDLRLALGYSQWNVFGHSYGTRLALTVLRDYPNSVRSVILDSVLPPEANFDESASANLLRSLHVVFDGCATNPACHAAYPEPEKDFFALVAAADKTPLPLKLTTADGKPVIAGGAEVVDAIYSALHNPGQIPLLPRIVSDATHGKYEALAALVKDNQGPSGYAWGLRLSVWCGEEMPFEDARGVEHQTSPAYGLGRIDERTASIAMCRAWNVAKADDKEKLPVKSDVPVLVLTGEFDPDTPPDWGRGLLANMPNAAVVLFPGNSHGAGFNRCGAQIETAFLRDPKAPVVAGCAQKMRGADFALSAQH